MTEPQNPTLAEILAPGFEFTKQHTEEQQYGALAEVQTTEQAAAYLEKLVDITMIRGRADKKEATSNVLRHIGRMADKVGGDDQGRIITLFHAAANPPTSRAQAHLDQKTTDQKASRGK